MALNMHLTRGRKQTHNQAACVYMTCRTEKTERILYIFENSNAELIGINIFLHPFLIANFF